MDCPFSFYADFCQQLIELLASLLAGIRAVDFLFCCIVFSVFDLLWEAHELSKLENKGLQACLHVCLSRFLSYGFRVCTTLESTI